jgi:hypothetical protein
MRKPVDRASIPDLIKVNDHLRTVIEIVIPASGGVAAICRYIGKDVTDHTVATLMGVSPNTVRNLRSSGFGNLYNRASAPTDNSELKAKVESLQQAVATLGQQLAQIKGEPALLWMRSDVIVDQFNRAIDNLALNRALPGGSNLKIKPRAARPVLQAAE